jgi:prepilin-type N-terminal cleavage/methylation domain-containing protein
MRRRAFTLIELVVALGIVAMLAAMGYAAYIGVQQKSRDDAAINMADQVAANLNHYMGFVGYYPTGYTGQGNATWSQIMTALGSYAEFSTTAPSIFASPGAFAVYTDAAGSTFQIAFKAAGGTGTVYCRDPNGMAAISSMPSTAGPWSGCP